MPIQEDIQKLDPGTLVELFVLDNTTIGGGTIRLVPSTKADTSKIVWQGNTYEPFPVEITGLESSGQGQAPRPKVRVANVNQLFGQLNLQLDDLVGAKLTRKRTFAKYLDGEPGADPTAEFPNDIYYVERKIAEDKIFVEYELVGIYDFEGVQLPRRQIIGNLCWWRYRGLSGECPWPGGPPYYKSDDTSTIVPSEDNCGKRLTSCSLRFGSTATLPFGGFPGAGRYGR